MGTTVSWKAAASFFSVRSEGGSRTFRNVRTYPHGVTSHNTVMLLFIYGSSLQFWHLVRLHVAKWRYNATHS